MTYAQIFNLKVLFFIGCLRGIVAINFKHHYTLPSGQPGEKRKLNLLMRNIFTLSVFIYRVNLLQLCKVSTLTHSGIYLNIRLILEYLIITHRQKGCSYREYFINPYPEQTRQLD